MGAGRAKSPCEWGSGERDSSDDPWLGCRVEREISKPCSWSSGETFAGSGWDQCPGRAMAGGMQRERAAGSLAKMVCITHTSCVSPELRPKRARSSLVEMVQHGLWYFAFLLQAEGIEQPGLPLPYGIALKFW